MGEQEGQVFTKPLASTLSIDRLHPWFLMFTIPYKISFVGQNNYQLMSDSLADTE